MKLRETRLSQDPDEEVKYVIFCDLDGVLANFKASIQKVMGTLVSTNHIPNKNGKQIQNTDRVSGRPFLNIKRSTVLYYGVIWS